ncbi:hypothetical protein GW17_00049869 [Ensete ventricosum]|nr:hypothetical protein GW17_00049869 [Ensete ventricosum]
MKARLLTPIIRLQLLSSRRLCPVLGARPVSSATDHPDKAPPASSSSSVAPQSEVEARSEAYRRLENLDFMTAANILFTTPPKRKKFGCASSFPTFLFFNDEEESEAELSKVKARLDVLEEAVKEIADEKKKIPTSKLPKDQDLDKREKVTSVDEKSSAQSQLNTRSSDTERVGGSGLSADIATTDKERRGGQAVESGEGASRRSSKQI